MRQVTSPRDPNAVGFWRSWPSSKVLVFVAIGLLMLPIGVGGTSVFPALIMYLFVWNWISRDHRNYPGVLSRYGGVAFFLAWPVLVPFYLLETRGWKRTAASVLAVLAVILTFGVVGEAIAG